MSTADDPRPNQTDSQTSPANKPIAEVLGRGVDSPRPLPVDESAAALELRLQKETDGRQEDRFYGIAIGTVLVDMAVFPHLSVVGIICIFLLEIVVLLGLARRLGNEFITILLSHLFHKLCERLGMGKD